MRMHPPTAAGAAAAAAAKWQQGCIRLYWRKGKIEGGIIVQWREEKKWEESEECKMGDWCNFSAKYVDTEWRWCVSRVTGAIFCSHWPLPPGDHLLSIVIPYKAAEEHDLQRRREKIPTCNVSPSPSMMVPLSWNHWTLSYLTWVLRKVHIRIRFGGPTSSSSTVAHKTVLTQVPQSICVGCLSSISALSAIVFNSGTSKSKSEMASVVCWAPIAPNSVCWLPHPILPCTQTEAATYQVRSRRHCPTPSIAAAHLHFATISWTYILSFNHKFLLYSVAIQGWASLKSWFQPQLIYLRNNQTLYWSKSPDQSFLGTAAQSELDDWPQASVSSPSTFNLASQVPRPS